MTVARGKVRVQIAVPLALRDELDALAVSAGVPTSVLASVFLAQGVSASRPPASPVGRHIGQRIGPSTGPKTCAESESRPAEDDDWEAVKDEGFDAAEVLTMMEPAEREALLSAGWDAESIDRFMNDE